MPSLKKKKKSTGKQIPANLSKCKASKKVEQSQQKKCSRIWQLYPEASNMPCGWPWVLAAMLEAESV